MPNREELRIQPTGKVLRMVWRAIGLRCPECGGRPITKGWFDLVERCPKCGLLLERGEEKDYFAGGMMINIILAELIFAAVLTGVLVFMWPNIPWDGLEYGLVLGMIITPILLYPVSRVLWLALDLAIRRKH